MEVHVIRKILGAFMGILSHRKKGPKMSSTTDTKTLSELISYANGLGEVGRLTFFYSPVLEVIEGIHYGGRKTFPQKISLAVIRQWEQNHMIRLVRPGEKALKSRGSPSAILAFVIPEDILHDPSLNRPPGLSSRFNYLIRQVFP
jgi:hypothetical protein